MRKISQIKILILLFCGLFVSRASAQFGIIAGATMSNVQHNNLLLDEKEIPNNRPLFGYFTGLSCQFYPLKSAENVSFILELLMSQKGYKQKFANTTFVKRMNYITLPVMANYVVNKKISIHGGLEFAGWMRSPKLFKEADNTYNDFDLSVLLGAGYNFRKNWHIFSRLNYGLLPTLNYYKIDEIGNITPVKDIRNINLMIGIKFNFIYEKIKFF